MLPAKAAFLLGLLLTSGPVPTDARRLRKFKQGLGLAKAKEVASDSTDEAAKDEAKDEEVVADSTEEEVKFEAEEVTADSTDKKANEELKLDLVATDSTGKEVKVEMAADSTEEAKALEMAPAVTGKAAVDAAAASGYLKRPNSKEKREKTVEDYGLPIMELPIGTLFYSGVPRKLDPAKPLWTYMDPGVKYVYAHFTREDAREWLDKNNYPKVPTEDIDKFRPETPYARVFKAVRPCSFAIACHRHKEQLGERYARYGATFKNSEWYDQNFPIKPLNEWHKDEFLVKMSSAVTEANTVRGTSDKMQKANMRHGLDGFTACIHGAEAAIFEPVHMSPGEGESCIRPVPGDRLLTRAEYKVLEAEALGIQDNASRSCSRFGGGFR